MNETRLKLPTRVAAARWGDNLYCGHSVRDDLAGKISAWSAVSLAVGHRLLEREEESLLDDFVVCALAADPRIWPLKVARLLSSYGNFPVALVASMYCTEGGPIGWHMNAEAGQLLADLVSLDGEANRREHVRRVFVERKFVPGFGVGHREEDERAVALKGCVTRRGFADRRHWKVMLQVDEELRALNRPVNISGVSAAMMLDLGFSPTQLYAFGPSAAYPNYLANAVEGAAQAPEILRRLPASAIEDRTPASRKSPRAQGKP